jgi:polyisoprenoid-binding protein YceI
MIMKPSRLLLLSFVVACADPVGDKPRATVSEPSAATATRAAPSAAEAKEVAHYVFSQDGSKLEFVGAKVTKKEEGGFRTFSGTIDVPAGKIEQATITVEIDTSSIYSPSEKLTGHLKSPDFFDVEKNPKATFRSKSIAPKADGTVTITGDLTLHGVTKQISFPAKASVSGDTATATSEFGINRKDFGIIYPGQPDDLIKDEVLIKLDLNAKRRT